MSTDRFVVLGLAQVRSPWFGEVARWSTSAALPIEFVKTMSLEEVRVRLRSGRGHSALLIDDSVTGLDRDLVEIATAAGCAVVVVESARLRGRAQQVGASAILPTDFGRDDLLSILTQIATPIARHGHPEPTETLGDPIGDGSYRGHLIAVTGAGGTGRSTVAMAVAQGLGRDARFAEVTCLADLALHADQGVLHGADDVVPGLLELTEGHRSATLTGEAIRSLTWRLPDRGYHLLLGLRRHRDWSAVRPRAFAAGLDGLRRAFRAVVADVDCDVEGEVATGSIDIEERNAIARTTLATADLVVVVGRPGLTGLHGLLRNVRTLRDHGVPGQALLPVCNRAPRSPKGRAEIAAAFGALLGDPDAGVPSPLPLAERRHLDDACRDRVPLPDAWVRPIASAVLAVLERRPPASTDRPEGLVPVVPGSLGAWTEQEGSSPD